MMIAQQLFKLPPYALVLGLIVLIGAATVWRGMTRSPERQHTIVASHMQSTATWRAPTAEARKSPAPRAKPTDNGALA